MPLEPVNLVGIGIVVVEMSLVGEEENSRCFHFDLPLLFIFKIQDLKVHKISY